MRATFIAGLAVITTALFVASAGAVSLPSNQTFVDGKDRVSLLTRSGGEGYVTARTRCGRIADYRVRIRGGRVSTPRGTRYRIAGTVTTRSTVSLRIRRGKCSAAYTLRRSTEPQ